MKGEFMKKRILLITVLAVLAAGLAILFFVPQVDTSFATSATLKYYDYDRHIGVHKVIKATFTNEDLKSLKQILRGHYYGSRGEACCCVISIEITLTDGRENITFLHTDNRTGIIATKVNDKYIHIRMSARQRKQLNSILEKYGVVFA